MNKNIPSCFKLPFRIDDFGIFVFDKNNIPVMQLWREKDKNTYVVIPRGFGSVSYLTDSEEIWVKWEQFVESSFPSGYEIMKIKDTIDKINGIKNS